MLGDLTGLAFVVLVFGGGVISRILGSWEKRMELQAQRQQGQTDAVAQQIAALRAEIFELRDTSTRFDLSLENRIDRLEQRMNHIDARSTPARAQPETPNVLRSGPGHD